MTHTIAVTTPVRQSGKTLTAVNLAVALAICEKKTLLIDADPNQGTTYGTSLLTAPLTSAGFYAVMTDRSKIYQEMLTTFLPCLKILPAGGNFSGADFLFGETDGQSFHVLDRLKATAAEFDYIVIDTPATMPNLAKSLLLAADWVLMPLNMDPRFPIPLNRQLMEIKKQVSLIHSLRDAFSIRLKVAGILLNHCRPSENALSMFPETALAVLEGWILTTHLPESTDIREAFAMGKPAGIHDIMSFGAMAYLDLAAELMEKLNP